MDHTVRRCIYDLLRTTTRIYKLIESEGVIAPYSLRKPVSNISAPVLELFAAVWREQVANIRRCVAATKLWAPILWDMII